MRYVLFIIIAILTLVSWSGKHENWFENLLFWKDRNDLTWLDFQGNINHHTPHIVAITASSIIHYSGCQDGKIIYEVNACFEKDKSWVRAEGLNDYHLKHEQLHFDITELYARKLRDKLKNTSFKCHEKEKFDTFVKNHLVYWQAEQIQYDIDTQHSNNKTEQKKWEDKVKKELLLYTNYQ